jgi:serine/threonine protein kinase
VADSLFDNRYRYDYIYPRGRSGETLRAVDTQDNDRPVVVKRPAPNDAPPIRAGQEVSILNERKALTRLAGHPVLTALVGGGQFMAGGTAHQYIVIERGTGALVADVVRDLAQRGERLPDLELLVIVDALLDLLGAAHSKDIVYNDVDAKHLFWDREAHRLKLIDWGNAVFLEGDEVTAQGISRQTDIFQAGELLYSLVTGGGRADIPRDAGEDFLLNFGRDAERLSPRWMQVISKAAHPVAKLRYRSMGELRKALTELRDPLERERNTLLGRVNERLRHNRSKEELNGLLEVLSPALAADPGFPPVKATQQEIYGRLRDLEVAADLDAARIYMESGNWQRAAGLLEELRSQARDTTQALIDLLLETARLMLDLKISPAPQTVLDAVTLVFDRQNAHAASILLTQPAPDERVRAAQWLMAALVDAYSPEFVLLRPNLFQLDHALTGLATGGVVVTEPRAVLAEVQALVERLSDPNITNLTDLRDGYRMVVDGLTALGAVLETVNSRHNFPENRLPVTAQERALNAAMALADNMHVIGRQATSSPRDALNALDSSRAIDPVNPVWDGLGRLLDGLYELLGSYQTYLPAADGSDLGDWLTSARRDLEPFRERLFDDLLNGMCGGLEAAGTRWADFAETTLVGNRFGAITALAEATDAVGTISPTLAGWLNQVRTIVTNANYIERHALYGGLGRALADGWEAFDRGRLADAERLGQQAQEIARTESQRLAAARLRHLAEITRNWLERNTILNAKGTQAALVGVERLYTPEENGTLQNFTAQMPGRETYLKAMNKGLVDLFARETSASTRILFANYVLLGALEIHEGRLSDAEFWREAAIRTLGDNATRHTMTRALSEFADRKRDLTAASALLNGINNPAALTTLEASRRKLDDNPQVRLLAGAALGLREIENAVRDWQDGDFRPAGLKLENALKGLDETEQNAGITLTNFRAWLMELQSGAAELHTALRSMQNLVESRPEAPPDALLSNHRKLVDVTNRLIGEKYAATLRGWRDTYEHFLAVYTDGSIRRSEKINRFNQLMRAMFIDRHPAYSLYRHWYDLTDASPEFPAPPTDQPVPQMTEEAVSEQEFRGNPPSREARAAESIARARPPVEPDVDAELEAIPAKYREGRGPRPRLGLSPRLVIGAIILLALVGGGVVIASILQGRTDTTIALTISPTPSPGAVVASSVTNEAVSVALTSGSPTAAGNVIEAGTPLPVDVTLVTPTVVPRDTATPLPPAISDTPAPTATFTETATPTPSLTWTPSPTYTPSNTFTPTPTPTATLPPQGLQGEQNLLALFDRLAVYPWRADEFQKVPALEATYWRLGASADSPETGDRVVIALPADLLELYYGNNAASRIRRMELEFTFTYDPTLVNDGGAFLGALFQSVDDPANTVGAQLAINQPGLLSVGQVEGDEINTISQRGEGLLVFRLRLDRDPASGNVVVLLNGEQVGRAMAFTRGDAPILPVIYARRPNVVVSITSWSVTLR